MPTDHSITTKIANDKIKDYLTVLQKISEPGIFKTLPEELQNYFGPGFLSFVFYKKQLDDMYAKPDANAFRVYFALDPKKNPTLIIIPCYLNPGNEEEVQNITPVSGKIIQYPPPKPGPPDPTKFNIETDHLPRPDGGSY